MLPAHHKALLAHFKKSAAHHSAMATHNEKMAAAHEAHHEVHNEMVGKTDGDHKAFHKSSASFHKAMHGYHAQLHKAHLTHSELHVKTHAALSEGDAAKVEKIIGDDMSTGNGAANEQTPTPAAAAAAAEPTGVDKALTDSLDEKLSKAISGGIDRVLNSDSFTKMLDEKIASRMLERLGGVQAPPTFKSVPVPRPAGDGGGANGTAAGAAVVPATAATLAEASKGVDATLRDLVKMD